MNFDNHQNKTSDVNAFKLENYLQNIHIILVETTLPANIGSAARAMKTMGLTNLHVVNPKLPLDDNAKAHAAGATDLLENIQWHCSLSAALAPMQQVYAASSRQRSLPWPTLPLKTASQHIAQLLMAEFANNQQTKNTNALPQIAIMFGREDRGLTNDELALANFHLFIPANTNYGVLNLAAAVQVISYEMRTSMEAAIQHTLDYDKTTHVDMLMRLDWDEPPATQAQMQQLEEKLLALASSLDVYDKDNPRNTPKRLKRLLARTQLDRMEYNLIRATIKHLEKKLS